VTGGAGSSGDEEVSGYMGGAYTPVQFCTSPPLNVYKPRRSQSPPPKLFHMAAATAAGLAAEARAMRGAERGAFRPRCLGDASTAVSFLTEATGHSAGVEEEEIEGLSAAVTDDAEVEHRASPNKRHRATPRPHNIQRPCLDFEKMQQVSVWVALFLFSNIRLSKAASRVKARKKKLQSISVCRVIDQSDSDT